MGSKDRTFTSFCNRFAQNDSFPLTCKQNISGRILPAIAAERFVQTSYLMVECVEWSHEYMTTGNKPSHIDDAVNSVISSFLVVKEFENEPSP